MNVSVKWVNELAGSSLSAAEMRDLLTSRCASVDEIQRLREDLSDIVVGRVVYAARHPDSDHLWVTRVDDGSGEELDVVCGAPNVKQGALYPFARTGTVLPGGLKLEKRKIRGQLSNGMLCSARELSLGEDHTGVLELQVAAAPGTPLLDALPLGDVRLVLDVTPNRPDLLSHVGVAREVAAARSLSLRLPAADGHTVEPLRAATVASVAGVEVRLEDAQGCPRYVGAVLDGVSVAPSPEWMRVRLEAIGVRPVNNVVDVTNLLLFEHGQPMHAFDLDRLKGQSVVIRRAREGEKLRTLDGVERVLNQSMTVIADAETAQAVAGVMGGADSEVTSSTTRIFLEIASFSQPQIRRTRVALGLSTEASYRFERGVDPQLPAGVLGRALTLLIECCGGQVSGQPVDLYPVPAKSRQISLRVARNTAVLGEAVAPDSIASLLAQVGFGATVQAGGAAVEVVVPSWRIDVTEEIDLIEEVARLHGYASFSSELRAYRPGHVPDDRRHELEAELRSLLAGAGLLEARPMPFVRGSDAHVRVANPLSEDEAYLRRSILETLARRAEYNLAHMQRSVRLFEIGDVFSGSAGLLPVEEFCVGAVIMGPRRPEHFTESAPPDFDAWDAKWLAERIAATAFPDITLSMLPGGDDGTLWRIVAESRELGVVLRLQLDAPVWAAPAYGIELRLGVVESADVAAPGEAAFAREMASRTPTVAPATYMRYSPLPSAPAADFDVALLVPETVAAADVEALMRRTAGDLLESLLLFDEYRGAGLPPGTRSLAWRLTFRHPERTLRDKEVEGRRSKLLKTLEKELGVRQRSS